MVASRLSEGRHVETIGLGHWQIALESNGMQYTAEGIRAALATIQVDGKGLPDALFFLPQMLPTVPLPLPGGGVCQRVMNRLELMHVWPVMPLPQQVVLAAVLIGSEPRSVGGRLIASAYQDLCNSGSLQLATSGPVPGHFM